MGAGGFGCRSQTVGRWARGVLVAGLTLSDFGRGAFWLQVSHLAYRSISVRSLYSAFGYIVRMRNIRGTYARLVYSFALRDLSIRRSSHFLLFPLIDNNRLSLSDVGSLSSPPPGGLYARIRCAILAQPG